MKYIKYLFIILPLVIFAQEAEKTALEESYDWYIKDSQGTVLAIRGDWVNYEESWMRLSPIGTTIISKEGFFRDKFDQWDVHLYRVTD